MLAVLTNTVTAKSEFHLLPMYIHRYGTGEEVTTLAIQAFDRFARKLRSLELPLKITTVYSTSEVSRHARVFPPLGEKNKDKSEVRL